MHKDIETHKHEVDFSSLYWSITELNFDTQRYICCNSTIMSCKYIPLRNLVHLIMSMLWCVELSSTILSTSTEQLFSRWHDIWNTHTYVYSGLSLILWTPGNHPKLMLTEVVCSYWEWIMHFTEQCWGGTVVQNTSFVLDKTKHWAHFTTHIP